MEYRYQLFLKMLIKSIHVAYLRVKIYLLLKTGKFKKILLIYFVEMKLLNNSWVWYMASDRNKPNININLAINYFRTFCVVAVTHLDKETTI